MEENSFNGLITKVVRAHEHEVSVLRTNLEASRTEIKRLHEILGSKHAEQDIKNIDSKSSLQFGDVDSEPFPPAHPHQPHPPAPSRPMSSQCHTPVPGMPGIHPSPIFDAQHPSDSRQMPSGSIIVDDEESPFYPRRDSHDPSELISDFARVQKEVHSQGVNSRGHSAANSARPSIGGCRSLRSQEGIRSMVHSTVHSMANSRRSSVYSTGMNSTGLMSFPAVGWNDVPVINVTAALNGASTANHRDMDVDDLDDGEHWHGSVVKRELSNASALHHATAHMLRGGSFAVNPSRLQSRQASVCAPRLSHVRHSQMAPRGSQMLPLNIMPHMSNSAAASRRGSLGGQSANMPSFAPSVAYDVEQGLTGARLAPPSLTTKLPTVRSHLSPASRGAGPARRSRNAAFMSAAISSVKRVRMAIGTLIDGHEDTGFRKRNSLVVPGGDPPAEEDSDCHVKFRDHTSFKEMKSLGTWEMEEAQRKDHVEFDVENEGEVKFQNPVRLKVRPEWIIKTGEEEKLKKNAESRQSLHSLMLEDTKLAVNNLELENSKYVLDPTATAQVCWDTIGFVFFFFDLIAAPLTVFHMDDSAFVTVMLWITTLFWTADFIRSFFLGYYGEGDIVKVLRKVALHYLCSWCILDFGLLFYDWMFLVIGEDLQSWRILRLMRCHKMWRLYTVTRFETLSASETANVMSTIGITVFVILVINHLIACGWYAVGRACVGHNENWLEIYHLWPSSSVGYRYATAYHWALTQFTPASIAIQPHNAYERVFAIFVLLFAIMLVSTLVSTVTKAVTQIQAIRANKTKQLWLLNKYLRSSRVPTPLALRIQHYCNYAWGRQEIRLNESNIQVLDLLSAPLRAELQMAILEPRFCFHPFFLLITKVAARVATRVCHSASCFVSVNPGDFLFSAGQSASHAFFIVAGTLTYNKQVDDPDWGYHGYHKRPSSPGGDIVHQSEGSYNADTSTAMPEMHEEHVGEDDIVTETVLWAEWSCVGSLQAEAECDIVGIEAQKFGIIVKSNPTARQEAQMFARNYVNGLNRLQMSQLSDLHQSALVEGLWFRLLNDFKIAREDYRESR